VSAPPSAHTCFLCPLDQQRCQTPSLRGMLVGARINQQDGREHPQLGIKLDNGQRVLVTFHSQQVSIIDRLTSLGNDIMTRLTVQLHHLGQQRIVMPAGGGESYIAVRALPSSLIIVQPDLLFNITELTHGDYCVRQELLRRLYPSPQNVGGVRGNLIHNIFKEMLKDANAQPDVLLDESLRESVVQLAEVGATEQSIHDEVIPHLRSLERWRTQKRTQAADVRAETFLIAPEIGLKGRLDILWDGEPPSLLELKTGRADGELPKRDHRWQVHGYHALVAARHEGAMTQSTHAVLLYSGTPGAASEWPVPVHLREIQRVLEIRNELVLVRVTSRVPTPPGGKKCERCVRRFACAETSSLLGWERPPGDLVSHVSAEDAAWFRRWYTLQQLEAESSDAVTHELWQKSPNARIEEGHAISIIEQIGDAIPTTRHEWNYRFRCDNTSEMRENDEVLISDGDPINGQIVSGAILKASSDEVVVWARERIVNPRLIDRYSADVNSQRMLGNLMRWLHVDDRLRALVRGTQRPRFESDVPPVNPAVFKGLNSEQADAVMRALTMKDYFLIKGPPGTGKTKVIASITRALIGRGYRVGLAAYTNQATDTMLSRVVEQGIVTVVRLGHELSVAPEMRGYRLLAQATRLAEESGRSEANSDDVRTILRRTPVVAATAATWSSETYEVEKTLPPFDVIIMDEATQVTIPAVLGALRWGRRFILVGDEKQLPPLVQSEAARLQGLGASLFELLLIGASEQSVIELRRQYRMHESICGIANHFFYNNSLHTDERAAQSPFPYEPRDKNDPLAPERPLVWIDVADDRGDTKVNQAEAGIAGELARDLITAGIAAAEVGIIAPFRAQVAAIRQVCGSLVAEGVTIDTVDRFQGGERRVIILSLVANEQPIAGSHLDRFLADPRRLNVALTRAQQKLIILGNRTVLAQMPLLGALVAYCDEHAHIIRWSDGKLVG
jgi:DNA replication ATP-dependent helicase Dna2